MFHMMSPISFIIKAILLYCLHKKTHMYSSVYIYVHSEFAISIFVQVANRAEELKNLI